MSRRLARFASLAVATACLTGGATLATAASASADTNALVHICPYGYYGVEVYDPQGRTIAYACVRG
jgi:hypothetical protein